MGGIPRARAFLCPPLATPLVLFHPNWVLICSAGTYLCWLNQSTEFLCTPSSVTPTCVFKVPFNAMWSIQPISGGVNILVGKGQNFEWWKQKKMFFWKVQVSQEEQMKHHLFALLRMGGGRGLSPLTTPTQCRPRWSYIPIFLICTVQ